MMKNTLLALLLAVIIPCAALAQEDNDKYITTVFKKIGLPGPGMAWLLPPDIVISDRKLPEILLLSNTREIQKARYVKTFSESAIARIRKKHGMACQATLGEEPVKYRLYSPVEKPKEPFGYPDRVFFMTKLPPSTAVGYTLGKLEGKALTAALSAIKASEKRYLHRHEMVAPLGSKYFYSLHSLYDKESGLLFRKAVLLHSPDGSIVAKRTWEVTEDSLCDGCPWPACDDEYMVQSFVLLNALTMKGFAYPVLMFGNLTLEVNGVSLATFDSKGGYSVYGIFEFIAECTPER